MERHGYDTIDSGIKSASGQIASEPASQLIGRTPAAPVLEIMNGPLPGTPLNKPDKGRSLHHREKIPQPGSHRILGLEPEHRAGHSRTAHHAEGTVALGQRSAADGTDRRQEEALQITEDRHRKRF